MSPGPTEATCYSPVGLVDRGGRDCVDRALLANRGARRTDCSRRCGREPWSKSSHHWGPARSLSDQALRVVSQGAGIAARRVPSIKGATKPTRQDGLVNRPESWRRELDRMAVGVADVETDSAALPAHFAFDGDAFCARGASANRFNASCATRGMPRAAHRTRRAGVRRRPR